MSIHDQHEEDMFREAQQFEMEEEQAAFYYGCAWERDYRVHPASAPSRNDQYEEARLALESGVAAVEKIIRDRDLESHIAQLRLERLMALLKPSDAVIVDMLTAFYREERDGWPMGEVRRMRAALAEVRAESHPTPEMEGRVCGPCSRGQHAPCLCNSPEPCPQPCEHLSAEDAREGRTCSEHSCTCSAGWRLGGEWWLEGVLYRELVLGDRLVAGYLDPAQADAIVASLKSPQIDVGLQRKRGHEHGRI